MYCKTCGSEMNENQAICLNCGCAKGSGTKYCANFGKELMPGAIACMNCGVAADFGAKPAEKHSTEQINHQAVQSVPVQQPVINIVNTNTNANTNVNKNNNLNNDINQGLLKKPINKWVSFILCLFLGFFGAHKFYEGKTGMGILYIFTGGLCGIGWMIDCVSILFKPNPYYV